MQQFNEAMKADLLATFPQIVQDQTPKYNKAFLGLERKVVMFRFRLLNARGLEATAALAIIAVGFGICWFFVRVRNRLMS
jgi:hypothetical protein